MEWDPTPHLHTPHYGVTLRCKETDYSGSGENFLTIISSPLHHEHDRRSRLLEQEENVNVENNMIAEGIPSADSSICSHFPCGSRKI